MQFTFTLMDEPTARAILIWRYDEPYRVYNMVSDGLADVEETVAELLALGSPYYAVRDAQEELIGYFCFGTSALVWASDEPGLYIEGNVLPLGLGLRPDMTGRGLGLHFVNAGLEFARQAFTPTQFCLYVFSWNERAIRVYERAGFQRRRIILQQRESGNREFLEMVRSA